MNSPGHKNYDIFSTADWWLSILSEMWYIVFIAFCKWVKIIFFSPNHECTKSHAWESSVLALLLLSHQYWKMYILLLLILGQNYMPKWSVFTSTFALLIEKSVAIYDIYTTVVDSLHRCHWNQDLSQCQHCGHWCHRRLPLWQPPCHQWLQIWHCDDLLKPTYTVYHVHITVMS